MSAEISGVIQIGENLYINFNAASLCSYDGTWKEVSLSKNLLSALRCLSQNAGIAVSGNKLIEYVWGYTENICESQVRKLIMSLRRTIHSIAPHIDVHQLLVTHHGHGSYSLASKYIQHFADLHEAAVFCGIAEECCNDSVSTAAQNASSSDPLDREYARARQFDINNQFEQCFQLQQRLAEQNYAPSINYLGVLYTRGEYVERNIQLGIEKYREAAKLNFPVAQMNLGDYHMNTLLGGYDPAEAVRLYRLAALNPLQPEEDAMYRLYLCYQYGLGVDINSKEAARWRAMAKEHGVNRYVNYYLIGLTAMSNHPMVTGDELLRRCPRSMNYAMIHLKNGHKWSLPEGIHMVGNNSSCYFNLSTADSKHALLCLQPNTPLLVIDLNSSVGTFINEQRIEPLEERALQDGDQIRFGPDPFVIIKH